jgi:RNA ligase (TIGR02306 family)
MRKLATIRKILDIHPIPGADAIECVTVDGWKVVAKKGEFQIGQLAIYFEIDSWIPEPVAPFLCKDKREFNGVPGARLRTIKLRGQISQGLLLPAHEGANEGDDLTEALGIQKYEAPVSVQLAGVVRGNFPSFIPKTDQERIQNLRGDLARWSLDGGEWEVTEKLDGSSMTAYLFQEEFGVCSRNLDLKDDPANSFWRAAHANGLESVLRASGRNLALQGELIGPGIQGNPYALTEHQFRLFDIYDIDAGRYLTPSERHAFVAENKLPHAPVIGYQDLKWATIDDLLGSAEGKSTLHPVEREGLVFKCVSTETSFKAISNKFLLKERT